MVGDETTVNGESTKTTFEAFFADRYVPLSRIAFLLTGSSAAADEIAQDACEQVYRRWAEIRHPHAYARIAVVNGARSWGRRRTTRRAAPIEPAAHVELDADAVAVRSALAELPDRQRAALVLRFYADLKVDDIAAALDCPPGTVKSLIHRGLARVQEELT